MTEFNYRNNENYIRLLKYFIGFISIYGVTILYFINERKNINPYVSAGFLVMCILLSIPFINALMKILFEKIVVTTTDIRYYKNFKVLKMPWSKVQYFIRLPSRGFFTGLIIYYEMGDFKKKIVFESTINDREKLIKFIQGHVGKLRRVRKVYR